MIGKIVGIFSGYYSSIAIIDVTTNDCSVGYEITMKKQDILSMIRGKKYTIFVKEIIKEDDYSLYGFLSFEEKCWFEEFIKLSGLGAKIAISILSTFSCQSIAEAIMTNNCDFFSSISGIGSKIANRIPNEMRKNIEKINEKVIEYGENNYFNNVNSEILQDIVKTQKNTQNTDNSLYKEGIYGNKIDKNKNKKGIAGNTKNDKNRIEIINDAVSALTVLGFSRNNVYNDVFALVKENNSLTTEEIVKKILKKNDR